MTALKPRSQAYRLQAQRIARRAGQRATRRYRVPALILFCAGLGVSYYGHGPAAVSLAVILGCAAVFLSNIDIKLRK
jgi:Sec-independent protein secretion pathway component TatC